MGNYKFKLSDMIPNAWFYKLKDSSRTRNQTITNPTKKKHQQTSSSSSSSTAALAQPSKMQQSHLINQRKSYHFTRDQTAAPNQDTFYNLATNLTALDSHYPEPPGNLSKKRRSTKRNRHSNRQSPRLITSSVSAGCSCRATLESVWTKLDSTPEDYPNSPLDSSSGNESLLPQYGSDLCLIPETFDGMLSWSASCRCRVDSDLVVEMEIKPFSAKIDEPDKLDSFDTVSELDLPPIITKPNKARDMTKDTKKKETNEPTKIKRSSAKFEQRNAYGSFSVKVVKEDIVSTSSKAQKSNPVRKSSAHSPGVKLRTNSPRIASRRIQGRKSLSSSSSSSSRRSLSESVAVVKSSKDPRKDFRESMVEMIFENNIFASKDLEDLLACYLSLNSDEYHDLIIKVFKQIWFDIIDPRLK